MPRRSPLITVMANAAYKAAKGLARDFGDLLDPSEFLSKISGLKCRTNLYGAADEAERELTIEAPRPEEFDRQRHSLLNEELKMLYTAITRARALVVVVGSRRAMERAINNTEQAERTSYLAERLRDQGATPPD